MASKLPWLNVNVFACKISHNATLWQLTENIIFLQLPSHANWLDCVILTCYKYFNSFLWYLTSYGFFFFQHLQRSWNLGMHRTGLWWFVLLLYCWLRREFVLFVRRGNVNLLLVIALFHIGDRILKHSFLLALISLSNLVVMRRIQRKIETKVRPVGVINIKIKE